MLVRKENKIIRKENRYKTMESSQEYSDYEISNMSFLTYCDKVLGIHLSKLLTQPVLIEIATAYLDYLKSLMDLEGINLGNTYDDFVRCLAEGRPRRGSVVDVSTQSKFDRIVDKLKRKCDHIMGGVLKLREAKSGDLGHFPIGIVIKNGYRTVLDIPLSLCFAPIGKLRLLSLDEAKNSIKDGIKEEIQSQSEDWEKGILW